MAKKLYGQEKHPLYVTYRNMILRCTKPSNQDYSSYGGRGITVCERWLSSFTDFCLDMGEKPQGYSLNRIDNDKGYSPDNCEWASPRDQALNTRKNNGHSNIYFNKRKDMWYVQAMIDRRRIWGGYHETLEQALIARKQLGI